MSRQNTPTDKTPEHVPPEVPVKTPADLGAYESNGVWQQRPQQREKK